MNRKKDDDNVMMPTFQSQALYAMLEKQMIDRGATIIYSNPELVEATLPLVKTCVPEEDLNIISSVLSRLCVSVSNLGDLSHLHDALYPSVLLVLFSLYLLYL